MRKVNGSYWADELTPEECAALCVVLASQWTPLDNYEEIMSAYEKLERRAAEAKTQEDMDA